MKWDWRRWAEEKGLRKWFRRDNFLILILTGVLLVIIALPTREKEKEGNTLFGTAGQTEGDGGTEARTAPADSQGTAEEADVLYASYLEERLTEVLSRMADVGEVRVMITLKTSRELVVEKEQPVRRSATSESDSLGGSRSVSEVDSDESTVYRTEGGRSEPYVVKTLAPRIEGVLVVAQGAGSGTVSRTISEAAQALFDVEAHKVKVVRME